MGRLLILPRSANQLTDRQAEARPVGLARLKLGGLAGTGGGACSRSPPCKSGKRGGGCKSWRALATPQGGVCPCGSSGRISQLDGCVVKWREALLEEQEELGDPFLKAGGGPPAPLPRNCKEAPLGCLQFPDRLQHRWNVCPRQSVSCTHPARGRGVKGGVPSLLGSTLPHRGVVPRAKERGREGGHRCSFPYSGAETPCACVEKCNIPPPPRSIS